MDQFVKGKLPACDCSAKLTLCNCSPRLSFLSVHCFQECGKKVTKMNIQSLRQISDPTSLASDHLCALWYDLNGDWDTAHNLVQRMSDINAMWIHAYLHRKEPDIWNAKYWYRNSGKPYPGDINFDEEAATILVNLA
jgi:hypothetical protein